MPGYTALPPCLLPDPFFPHSVGFTTLYIPDTLALVARPATPPVPGHLLVPATAARLIEKQGKQARKGGWVLGGGVGSPRAVL